MTAVPTEGVAAAVVGVPTAKPRHTTAPQWQQPHDVHHAVGGLRCEATPGTHVQVDDAASESGSEADTTDSDSELDGDVSDGAKLPPAVVDEHDMARAKTHLIACVRRHDSVAQVCQLLAADKTVSLNTRDAWGWTILHSLALRDTASRVVPALIVMGADPRVANNGGETPLHIAAANNSHRFAALLLASLPDAQAQDLCNVACIGGRTPLHVAVRKGSTETAALLLAMGADTRRRTDLTDETPLAIARYTASHRSKQKAVMADAIVAMQTLPSRWMFMLWASGPRRPGKALRLCEPRGAADARTGSGGGGGGAESTASGTPHRGAAIATEDVATAIGYCDVARTASAQDVRSRIKVVQGLPTDLCARVLEMIDTCPGLEEDAAREAASRRL